jgi:hypothetical protein
MDGFEGQLLRVVQQRVMGETTAGVFAWPASRTFTNRMFATKTTKAESSSHTEMYLLADGKRLKVLAVCYR